MPLVNCQTCGKAFFSSGGRAICPECKEAEQTQFETVREFLKDNPQTAINTVSEETGVPAEKILEYLNQGLIEITNENAEYQCQLCKKTIGGGNYCTQCLAKLKKGLKTSEKKNKSKDGKNNPVSFTAQFRNK